MDRKQLESKLNNFFNKCIENNYPLDNYCLIENDDDYILEVKAQWIDGLDSCSEVLDILNNFLWETTDVETRKQIFAISILDSDAHPHCYTEIAQ